MGVERPAEALQFLEDHRLDVILLVEDDPEARILVERDLEGGGHEVISAGDGVEALLHLGRRSFDLVLPDIRMPNLDALELLELMSDMELTVPVVFLTARYDDASEDFLSKPVRKDVLLLRIGNVPRRIRARDARRHSLRTRQTQARGEAMSDRPSESELRPFLAEGPIPVVVEAEVADLVPRFLENRRGDVETLRRAVEEGDADTVERLGHRMKGIGGGYGFEYVSRAGAVLEEAGRDGRLDDARPWIEALADYVERVAVEVGPAEG